MQLRLVAIPALLLSGAAGLSAQSASHAVTFSVTPIDQLSVSGAPVLNVVTAVAGSQPTPVSDASSSYAITTNGSAKKITAQLDAGMPSQVELFVTVEAPAGSGASAGRRALGASAVEVVTGIAGVVESGLPITYELSAQTGAGTVSGSRVVTFTITDGS